MNSTLYWSRAIDLSTCFFPVIDTWTSAILSHLTPTSLTGFHVNAMSDPVASKSTFLCMYMTNHPDTLVAYVKHFGKIPGNVVSAEMKSIDSKVC